MENAEKIEIDKALGKFFFGCNIPFCIVESPFFKNFLRLLNPTYTPPSRKTLSNNILNAEFEAYQRSIMQVNPKDAELLIDGWKNSSSNNKYVVGMVRLSDGRYIYLDSWNFSNVRETGVALTEIVEQCINMAREQFNLNIYAVITDNASNMMSMGKNVNLWHMTCSSHSANLLCKGLISKEFSSNVVKVLKEFKSPALESQILALNGHRIILPAETRWCSHRDAFRRCLQNLNIMRQIADGQAQIKDDVRNFLFDPNFEMILQDYILMLDPICTLTNKCQTLDCSLAESTELWFRLDVPVENDQYRQLIDDRIKKAVNCYSLAANFLHPAFQGLRFVRLPEYRQIMDNFFAEVLCDNGKAQLELYKNKDEIFELLFRRNFQSPITFWKVARNYYPELSELALKLNYLCSSTGQLERLFSKWAHVHSLKRNKLREDRSAKLVALYYDLNLSNSFLLNELNNENLNEDIE